MTMTFEDFTSAIKSVLKHKTIKILIDYEEF